MKPEGIRSVLPEISSEHGLEHAFGQLQAQLMTSSTLEDRFSILQELQEGVRKFSTVKRLVWRVRSEKYPFIDLLLIL